MTFKRKAVLVEWTDSCSFTHHRWRDVAEAAQLTPSTIQSVGFVLVDVKTHLVLTGSLDESDNTSGTHTIPRGAITRIRRLK